MAISIKGVNTGVIRKSNNFIALALKIKELNRPGFPGECFIC
ncbi:TPA: hypothetical protein OZT57_004841, partial [Escherichia coli]|nr:hypothetical protein [Escherichia coli]HAM7460882.1 hypothetical protein [Escherichia coli]HAO1596649.1 hypothetical protein [Escherichia coli]HBN5379441.1 hypothetical protein [Escherichia coli]HBN5685445.1 hypothetical protein [Escherichia coli]